MSISSKIISDLYSKKSDYWTRLGRLTAVRVANGALSGTKAYKKYIQSSSKRIRRVKSWNDFLALPISSKKDFLKKFPRNELIKLSDKPIVFSATSGSTGEPYYFPRNEDIEWQYSLFLEIYLKGLPIRKTSRTLIIVGFGMGVWIGGLITYKAFELLAKRGVPLSIITPGVNKKEIINALIKLSPDYDHTVLVGYPPFIKDILDEAPSHGVDFKKLSISFLFAAESFSEPFRDYIAKKARILNIYNQTLNIYGTADIGAMAFETPTSILIRRLLIKHPELLRQVFSASNRLPTLAQYNPNFVHFEALNGEVVLTGDSVMPLTRYAVGDRGGTFDFKTISELLRANGIDLTKQAKAENVILFELPFVYVYERNDFSTTLYGLQIYPETIKDALMGAQFEDYLTGKFTMETIFDKKNDQILEINIELKSGVTNADSIKSELSDWIVSTLRTKNSEFRELSDHLKERAVPRLIFWANGDTKYFQSGVKQKWVKK